MKKRSIAMLLALALVLSLCAVTAAAGEKAEYKTPAESQAEEIAGETENGEETAEEAPEPLSLAGPDAEPETDPETGEGIGSVQIEPDAVGTVSFSNVERRMRESNLQVLGIQRSIDTIEDIDYDKMYENLRKQLNEIAQAQWGLVMAPAEMVGGEYEKDKSYNQLDQAYDAVREKFDAIKDGDIQKDNADLVRQLKNLQDQIVVAGESTYVALKALETQETQLQRQLAALNRTVEEMELRYQLGQVSALQLQQTKAGRTQLSSGLETLRMNVRSLKMQMEQLIGAEQTGEIVLGQVPEVTDKELAAMDLETDLLTYKAKSYDLYDAAKTLEDAQETYKDDASKYSYNEKRYEFRTAKRTWETAQYTYNNTVQSYELKFRTLYAQVQDYKQILDAAKVSLACEQASCQASELKYQQGTISKNALLDAQDSLKEAEEKVQTAANDLFSSYNTYCWAVEHGVLN